MTVGSLSTPKRSTLLTRVFGECPSSWRHLGTLMLIGTLRIRLRLPWNIVRLQGSSGTRARPGSQRSWSMCVIPRAPAHAVCLVFAREEVVYPRIVSFQKGAQPPPSILCTQRITSILLLPQYCHAVNRDCTIPPSQLDTRL